MIPGCAPRYFCRQTVPGVFAHSIYGAARKEASGYRRAGVEFVRERKYHMEVRGANDFRPALVHPEFFADSLTDGTVPVTAGILVEFHVPAFAAFTDIDTQPAGLAGEDGTGSFSLFLGLEMSGLTVIRIGILPDVLDPEVTHGASLPSFQTGWERKKSLGRQMDVKHSGRNRTVPH